MRQIDDLRDYWSTVAETEAPIQSLARYLFIDRATLHKRVKTLLSLLPPDEIATPTVKRWRSAFNYALRQSGGAASVEYR